MSLPRFEVCLDDIDAVRLARDAGAFSIELAANLSIGGTTPSMGMIGTALENAGALTVHVMVRLRSGEFVYTPSEMNAMIEDVLAIRRRFSAMAGQIGFVLGPLAADGRVDREPLCRFVDAADGCPVTFHKAFDATRDLSESLAILKKSGVQRILTSGGRRLLTDGEAALQELVLQAADDVIILAAGQGAPPRHPRHHAADRNRALPLRRAETVAESQSQAESRTGL
jgi:copper homeostasis protein